MPINGEIVMENVRRYRAIASLYRQTAGFRPSQSESLLEQANEWEHLAVSELEGYFKSFGSEACALRPQVTSPTEAPWEMIAAA
jgi:hypothetical protein